MGRVCIVAVCTDVVLSYSFAITWIFSDSVSSLYFVEISSPAVGWLTGVSRVLVRMSAM